MAEKTIVGAGGMMRARAPYDDFLDLVSDDAGPLTLTLPNSGTYASNELRVELNGQLLIPVEDYTFLGVAPRTQISYLFETKNGDRFRFYKRHDL